ncbi:MAG: noncanonical pyrimidine nucleotidase, YjjG family [Bacteroidetes bacterium]|nr:MAG: noncanonical pyrimidine nucleotidase, YjjG family [Bacteroidota bacterium]MBL1144168.1 noncanonical pyrimidine nucleotidase, YjjG family [Bacteroidota bacterium]
MALKKYKHLFFDLDRTLWDFERNSTETITDLLESLDLKNKNIGNAHDFLNVYKSKNQELWLAYRQGKISKDKLRQERFHQAFLHFELNDPELALHFNDKYVEICSSKPHLLPNAKEVLRYLDEHYMMHIITNGFVEAQYVKIKNTGLENYFKQVVVSDGLGYRKPDKRIFHHAMKLAGASQKDSLMIGDDYDADIVGARAIGIDQVYFKPMHEKPKEATFEITDLKELLEFL